MSSYHNSRACEELNFNWFKKELFRLYYPTLLSLPTWPTNNGSMRINIVIVFQWYHLLADGRWPCPSNKSSSDHPSFKRLLHLNRRPLLSAESGVRLRPDEETDVVVCSDDIHTAIVQCWELHCIATVDADFKWRTRYRNSPPPTREISTK